MGDFHSPGAFFIGLCGNIGVGKSLFAERLGRRLNLEVYYEPVAQNPYLEPFYGNMRRWAFHLQIYFLAERFKAQKRMNNQGLPFIQDRTIYEDGEVFARVLHERGEMDDQDYAAYIALFREMVEILTTPGLLIYLHAGPSTLLKRIADRGRACEAGITGQYLQQLEDAYRHWLPRMKTECPVMELDTEDMEYPPSGHVLDRIVERIGQEAGKRRFSLAGHGVAGHA